MKNDVLKLAFFLYSEGFYKNLLYHFSSNRFNFITFFDYHPFQPLGC